MPRLLKAADIFCQPNMQPEPFGITFIEALNASLPVVAISMGAATEIVDHTCGLLSAPGNVEELAGNLQRLIEEPRLRRRLAEGGAGRARELCDPSARINDLFSILAGISRNGVHS